METYAAFLIGIGGGVSYMITTWLVLFKLKVDDPLDTCAGIYIARSFVASNIPDMKKKIFYKNSQRNIFFNAVHWNSLHVVEFLVDVLL